MGCAVQCSGACDVCVCGVSGRVFCGCLVVLIVCAVCGVCCVVLHVYFVVLVLCVWHKVKVIDNNNYHPGCL